MKKINYKIWPLGKLKKYQQRNELNLLKTKGYKWSDPWDAVELFEDKVAQYAGSKYAISCDCCSHGIFLVLKFLKAKKKLLFLKELMFQYPCK